MIVGNNQIINPSGDNGLDNWTVSGTVTIDGGFVFTSNSSIYQQVDIDPIPDPVPAKYRITASFINSVTQSRTVADFNRRMYAKLYYEDGTIGLVQVPLRIDITTEDHMALTWFHVSGEIELYPDSNIDHIIVWIAIGNIAGTVTVKDIHLVDLTEEEAGMTEDDVSELIQQSLYEGTLSKLAELAASASGFYVTYDRNPITGAIIYYQHDEPALADSELIYMMSEDGFFWTDLGWDGESTIWTSGWSATGDIVIKQIAAIGVSASWIVAGILSSINGYTVFNLDNGTFSVANGLLHFDDDGELHAKYLRIHTAESTEEVTFYVEGRAQFDDTTYHYAYAIPIANGQGVFPNLGDALHHWDTIYVDNIVGASVGGGSGAYVQDNPPVVAPEGTLWIDTDSYSRYEVQSVSSSGTLVLGSAELVLASGTITITLPSATQAGMMFIIKNIGAGTVAVAYSGMTSKILSSGDGKETFYSTGSTWVY